MAEACSKYLSNQALVSATLKSPQAIHHLHWDELFWPQLALCKHWIVCVCVCVYDHMRVCDVGGGRFKLMNWYMYSYTSIDPSGVNIAVITCFDIFADRTWIMV